MTRRKQETNKQTNKGAKKRKKKRRKKERKETFANNDKRKKHLVRKNLKKPFSYIINDYHSQHSHEEG